MNQKGYLKLKCTNLQYSENINKGDIIGVTGVLCEQKNGSLYLDIEEAISISKCDKDLPNAQYFNRPANSAKTHERIMIQPDAFDLFKKRSLMIRKFREILNSKDFYEIETPILLEKTYPSAAKEFFAKWHARDKNVYLRKAIETKLKLMIIGGFERIYEIGKIFRNEGKAKQFLPEFTGMDILQAYTTYRDMMDLSEELVLGAGKIFDQDKIVQRYTLEELLRQEKIETRANVEDFIFFRKHIQPQLKEPTIVFNFPSETAPLAKPCADNPKYAEEFRLFANGYDLLHGYSFETNSDRIRSEETKQIKASKKDENLFDISFQEALFYGMPPTSGIGVGIDRIIQYFSGKNNIRDIVLFPLI